MNPRLRKLTNNFHRLDSGNLIIWFSYETPIAFYDRELEFFLARRADHQDLHNTQAHLNYLDDPPSRRVPRLSFETALAKALEA